MNFQAGEIFCIDKPYGMSSFGALARVRYLISRKLGIRRVKIGHAGTLDPLATGVLILCTGRATKQIDALQIQEKEYVAELQLGATTVSYDREHPVSATFPTDGITRETLQSALETFVGDILQTPPSYSACKINGERAYQLKRQGEEIELQPKQIHIETIELQDFDAQNMTARIRVVCGKGTYIRALARDIGRALHSGAYLTSLRRTRVGNYSVDDCIPFDHFKEWLDEITIETIN